jgi:predicted kinase
VYAEVLRRAELALRSGRAVVLDACFIHRRDRAAARALARRYDVPFRFVECRIDDPTQRARLAQRERESGQRGWLEIARTFAATSEPVNELSKDEHLVLDTSRPSGESAVQLAPHLPAWPDGVPG